MRKLLLGNTLVAAPAAGKPMGRLGESGRLQLVFCGLENMALVLQRICRMRLALGKQNRLQRNERRYKERRQRSNASRQWH